MSNRIRNDSASSVFNANATNASAFLPPNPSMASVFSGQSSITLVGSGSMMSMSGLMSGAPGGAFTPSEDSTPQQQPRLLKSAASMVEFNSMDRSRPGTPPTGSGGVPTPTATPGASGSNYTYGRPPGSSGSIGGQSSGSGGGGGSRGLSLRPRASSGG